MARNRVGVEAKGEEEADEDTVQAVGWEEKRPTPVEDDPATLEQKRRKKQKELLRKKKAERRAHAKQRKAMQEEQEEPVVLERDEPLTKSQEEMRVQHPANGPAKEPPVLGGVKDILHDPLDRRSHPPKSRLEPTANVPTVTEATAIGIADVDDTRTPLGAFSHDAKPLQQRHTDPEVHESEHDDRQHLEEPLPRVRQGSHTREHRDRGAPEPSSSSLPSDAPTLSAEEAEQAMEQALHPKKVTKSRAESNSPDGNAAARTIQKAMKKSLLKKTRRTLQKAKSFMRHSSKVLAMESAAEVEPISTRPAIVPPLILKPRSPLPSSADSASDGEKSDSQSESSPTRTLSHPSSESSCSTCSGRSRSDFSASSASSSSERSRHHRKRELRKGPSVDMLLPRMPQDDRPVIRKYGELHDYMATRIQAQVRGMRGRMLARQREAELEREIRAEALREVQEEASVRIQAHVKGFLERRRLGIEISPQSKSRHHHRHHKHPYTKSNSVMPQCMVDGTLGQDGEPVADDGKVAEWPQEFNLEPLDTWDELNSATTPQGEPVTTANFLSRGKLRVFCGTWNLHAKKPTDDLRLWIPANRYHIVAVGTEECVHSIAKSVVFTSKKQWEDQLKETLGAEYVLVAAHSLTAIHNVVFVHESVLPYVHNIQSDAVATGLGNQLGNKGGVGIAFCVGQTSLAFVNSHFDAHQHNVSKRNANFHRINQELKLTPLPGDSSPISGISSSTAGQQDLGKTTASRFSSASRSSSSALPTGTTLPVRAGSSSSFRRRKRAISECFDRVFWYGDLNYRINGTRRMIDLLLLHNYHAVLRFNDQLRIEMHKGNVFAHFQEGPLHFRPTYKFDKHSNVYDSGPKQRIPSWTDRILYLSNDKPQDIELLSYRSHMNFQTSDHRPVGAVFQVQYARPGLAGGKLASTGEETAAARAERRSIDGGEEAQAFARVLAKGYKPTQTRSEVCSVQ